MVDSIRQHLLYSDENWCSEFVEVADDEFPLKILKFKMATDLF